MTKDYPAKQSFDRSAGLQQVALFRPLRWLAIIVMCAHLAGCNHGVGFGEEQSEGRASTIGISSTWRFQ